MRFTQGALGMLAQRYRGILKKCHMLNVLGGVAISAFLMGSAGMAVAAAPIAISDTHQVADGAAETYTTIDVNNGGTLAIARNAKVSGSDVTVNTGGTLTSAKNLHFGSFSPEPGTGLLGSSLTLDGGTVSAQHMGLAPSGMATLKKGMLTLNSLDMRNGTFAFNVAGGDSATLTLLGTTDGTDFLQGTSLSVGAGNNVFLGADSGPGGNQTSTTSLAVSGGSLQVGHGNWQTGDLTQTGGQAKISGNAVLTVNNLDQTGGLLTVGGTTNSGKLVVNGSVANAAYAAGSTGVAVTGTGSLQVKYNELVNATGDDFKDSATQHAINVANGGTLLLNGYAGSGMTLAEFKTLSDKLLAAGSTGTVQGITVSTSGASLQDVGDARLATPTAVINGSGGLASGAATVGGITGATTVSGNAALTLTGQTSGNVLADSGVTLNGGILTLGNPAGGSTGGTLQGGINASTGTNTINVINGTHTVAGGLTGNATTTVAVGSSSSNGTLVATGVSMNGGQLNFDPPFAAAGDTLNASMGGLTFTANTVDALMTVGQNSMVSLGSTDAEWLRTEVLRYQSDGKGLWGQDITAALALRTPQTLSTTGGINVDGTWVTGGAAATANTAHFANKSLLVVDAAGIGSGVALSGEAGGTSTLTVDSGAKLHIVGGQDGETLNVTGGFGASTKDAASWTGSNLTTSTALLSATGGTFDTANGAYSVSLKANAASSSFPMLSNSMGALVDRMVVQTGVNPNSPNAGVRFVSRAMSDNYIGTTDRNKAAATVEGAAQMAAVGAVQGSTLSAATAASGAVLNRTSMALPRMDMSQAVAVRQDTDGSLSLDSGLSAGDGLKNGLGVWIMPLYQSNNVWGMKAENFKTGYNSNLGGIALGADYTINDMFRFGAAFNVGAGYAKSNGDFNSTDNRFNFWGVSLYGGWVYNNFGLSADVGYTGNYSKVEQDMPASMQMSDLKADVTSHAWNTGLKAEYKFNAGALDIIPHVGVRYLGLVTDCYDVKSGGTVFEVDESTQSIWTFPVGVSFAKAFETESGWQIKPQLDLGVIPAAGDVKSRSKARVPGVDSQAEMKMQVVDYATFDGGLGFELGKGDFTLGLNYNLQASEHRTGHGVFGSLRYEF